MDHTYVARQEVLIGFVVVVYLHIGADALLVKIVSCRTGVGVSGYHNGGRIVAQFLYGVENGHYQSLAARACAYREYDGIYGVRQFVAFEIFSYTFLRLWYLAYHKRAVGKFADRAFCRSVCGSQQPAYEDG